MPAMEKIAGIFILVGLMGSGKSTLGRQLATHFHYSFYDSDQVIVDKTGVSIPTIFEMEGETGFRQREKKTIETLCAMDKIVLATGGGAILLPENRQLFKQKGVVIYLHALPETVYVRTKNDKNRPLLQVDDPLARFRQLYQSRDRLYREVADIVIEVGKHGVTETLQQIIQQIERVKKS